MPLSAALPQPLCADNRSFSLHAAMRCAAHECQRHEQLCRHITRPSMANERAQVDSAGQVVLKFKIAWRDGTMRIVMPPLEFMQCLAALVPRSWLLVHAAASRLAT